jgi:hypothetical protein
MKRDFPRTELDISAHLHCCRSVALVICGIVLFAGCAPLRTPNSPFHGQQLSSGYQQQNLATAAGGAMNEKAYYAVKQAKSENAVVLQVVDEKPLSTVLPLPEAGRTAYVSELLTQSGVIQKLGHVQATLYRYSPEFITGLPMEIKMGRSGDNVQPASDYALQAGDRLVVEKSVNPALAMLFEGILGQ